MNIYDFDGTVYKGDSTVDLYKFLIKRHPLILRRIPVFAFKTLGHKAGKCSTTEWKTCFFGFLKDIDDIESEIKLFWKKNMKNIYRWYMDQRKSDDVIISASPEFLLKQPCKALGAGTLIASKVDMKTGRFDGLNCKGEEKVKRFRALFPDEKADSFYSDSLSDLPMAKISERAYLIKNGEIIDWKIVKGEEKND